MIPQTEFTLERNSWQQLMKCNITDPQTLAKALGLKLESLTDTLLAHQDFKVNVPLPYLSRIEPGNPDDPLLKQVIASASEVIDTPGYCSDPVGDSPASPIPGLIHKYHGRVLLIASTHCAINCRYCFRRHFPYNENRLNQQHWQAALDYIANNPEISEVIYSGGDPLSASDSRLRWLTQQIADIPHIKRLRIHTRLPVVIPQRITAECLEWISETRLEPVMVLHINHPNEIDQDVRHAALQLKEAGVTLLNQTVLLRGINDNSDTLSQLSEALFSTGILPYYLHLLDRVQGAAHFDVVTERACKLMTDLRTRLPGYLVPKLVREVASTPFKQPVM